jgi:hypothetical protein
MKLRPPFRKLLLLAASLGLAAPVAIRAQSDGSAPPAAADAPEPALPGTVIPRPQGGYLALTATDDSHFKLLFFDKKKKPEKADVTRALLRYTSLSHPQEITVMNPNDDGTALISARIIFGRPRVFRVFLSLFNGDGDTPAEHYVVTFSG